MDPNGINLHVRGCRHYLRRPKSAGRHHVLPRFNARVPLAFLAAGIYLLGTVTGDSLLALLRRSIE
jgi:hypothetical protein